jgi:hypothetical protein
VFFETDNIESPGSCFAYGKGAALKETLVHGRGSEADIRMTWGSANTLGGITGGPCDT